MARKRTASIPFEVYIRDWKADAELDVINKILAMRKFAGQRIKIVDCSDAYGGDCFIWVFTVATVQRTPEEWLPIALPILNDAENN